MGNRENRGAGRFVALTLAHCLSSIACLAEEPISAAAAAYREGRYFAALIHAASALEENPADAAAKNLVWGITRKIQKERTPAPLSSGEAERAVRLADKALGERRRRTREILSGLEDVRRKTAVRNPRDILSGLEGMDRFLGKDLSMDLAGEQARAYQREILANLQTALQGKVFISRKDHLRAEGYLAYFRGDWAKAHELWSLALREDPSDARLSEEAASLKGLLDRKARAEKLDDLVRQGRIHLRAGNWGLALKTWEEASVLDPSEQEARAGVAAAKVALEKESLRRKLKERTDEGLAIYRGGDALGAAQVWLEVLQQDPSFEEARAWLQHAGRKIKSTAPAVSQKPPPSSRRTEGSAARNPARAMDLYKEGVVLYAQDNVSRAVELWKDALALDPSLTRAHEALRQAQAELALQ